MARRLLQYEVLQSLGQGARSSIYAVIDPQTKQCYALKHVVRRFRKATIATTVVRRSPSANHTCKMEDSVGGVGGLNC